MERGDTHSILDQQRLLPPTGFRSSCGRHLAKVRHEGRPVSRAEGTRVDGGTTGVGREGEVRGDPSDGGDETRDTSACISCCLTSLMAMTEIDWMKLVGECLEDSEHSTSQTGPSGWPHNPPESCWGT